jgi:hypothetical protein
MIKTCGFQKYFATGLFWIYASVLSSSQIVPSKFLNDLRSPEFKIREQAEIDLLKWSRIQLPSSTLKIFKHSQIAEDPEVRERCLNVLRKLVGDEYMTEGDGYIGIALSWKDDVVVIPGENKTQNAIRVNEVMANSPGQQSGIMVNDLIIRLEGEVWHEVDATAWFLERIKKMKPASVVAVTILRGDKLVDVKVTLSRRPLMADHPQNIDLEASELAAKEAHFQRWLTQKKALK